MRGPAARRIFFLISSKLMIFFTKFVLFIVFTCVFLTEIFGISWKIKKILKIFENFEKKFEISFRSKFFYSNFFFHEKKSKKIGKKFLKTYMCYTPSRSEFNSERGELYKYWPKPVFNGVETFFENRICVTYLAYLTLDPQYWYLC